MVTQEKSRFSRLPGFVVPILVVIVLWAIIIFAYKQFRYSHYKAYIPASIEIEDAVDIATVQGGFLEGSGIAVFSLSARSAAELQRNGLNALAQARQARGNDRKYVSWRETPFPAQSPAVFLGLVLTAGCIPEPMCTLDIDTQRKRALIHAAQSPGSYYSQLNENAELFVVPQLGLIVFAHSK